MRKISAVVFDLYGTLIRIHTEEDSLERLWQPLSYFFRYQGADYTAESLRDGYRAAIAQEEKEARQRTGLAAAEINFERVFAALFSQRGVAPESWQIRAAAQMLRACSARVVELYPGAREMLASLRAAGYGVYLLSNAQRLFTEYEMRMLGIYDSFDGIRISSDWDFKKPAPEFFRCLLQELPWRPEEVMMVGNSPHDDMLPALSLGMATCFLNTDHVAESPPCDLVFPSADYTGLLAALGVAWQ